MHTKISDLRQAKNSIQKSWTLMNGIEVNNPDISYYLEEKKGVMAIINGPSSLILTSKILNNLEKVAEKLNLDYNENYVINLSTLNNKI